MNIRTITDFLAGKLRQNLPSLEPETEEERLYEEGKKRIYTLHQEVPHLFYVENVWLEEENLHVYGVFAKGEFPEDSILQGLDNYGEPLFQGQLKEMLLERPDSVKVKRGFFKTEPKVHLVLSCLDNKEWGEDYIYSNYLVCDQC